MIDFSIVLKTDSTGKREVVVCGGERVIAISATVNPHLMPYEAFKITGDQMKSLIREVLQLLDLDEGMDR